MDTPETPIENGAGQAPVVALKIGWGAFDGLETIYANQLIVQRSAGEIYLVFGELVPPVFGLEDMPDRVLVKPKVRFAISPDNLRAFARVLTDQLNALDESAS